MPMVEQCVLTDPAVIEVNGAGPSPELMAIFRAEGDAKRQDCQKEGADHRCDLAPDPVDLAPERPSSSGPRHRIDTKWPLTPEETLDPARIAEDNAVLDTLIAEEQKKRAEAERLATQIAEPPQAPVPASALPSPMPSAPVRMPQAIRQAIAAGAPVAALTTRDLGPDHVTDLLGADAAKRRDAQVARQAAVTAAWQAQPRALTVDIDVHTGEQEPRQYAIAASVLATNSESPLAAAALLDQIIRVEAAVTGTIPTGAAANAVVKTTRALINEKRPRDGTDAALAGQQVMLEKVIAGALLKAAQDGNASAFALRAAGIAQLIKANGETARQREYLKRPRRPAGHRITIRDQGQAVIGDLHQASKG